MWGLVNNSIGKNKKADTQPKSFCSQEGDLISSPKEIANYFNDYFTIIGSKLARKLNKVTLTQRHT